MLFNSIEFVIFLPVVFIIYWFVTNRNLKLQNFFVVCASYVFYGWWDWKFLFLILCSTIVDFSLGIWLDKQEKQRIRKYLLWISILVNLGFLGFFKYYNFFIESFVEAFTFFGRPVHPHTLHIILPVGISFYTFQSLGYVIDVYKRKLQPTKDFVAFAAFVSFFPQLVAGPIERATHLLPQFYARRTFDSARAIDGLRQMLWGFFKKIVIADNCAEFANQLFNHTSDYSGMTLMLGAILFTLQIYGDFSGYSDIAIGTARLFGFNLMRNFNYPYFSRDIAEFWRRWHISLSTWFRDYLYIPLGGSRGCIGQRIRNTFIVFIVSGFWHGANWTFIAWGALHAFFFLPLLLSGKNRKNLDVVASSRRFPGGKELIQMFITFCLVSFAFIFFRVESITHAWQYISQMAGGLFRPEAYTQALEFLFQPRLLVALVMVVFMLGMEWMGRRGQYALEQFALYRSKPVRWAFYYTLLFIIFLFAGDQQTFIYFQF